MNILKLLKSCKELDIARNELRDLSKVSLPVCRSLNMTSNHISLLEVSITFLRKILTRSSVQFLVGKCLTQASLH